MKTVKDYYAIAYHSWFSEMLFALKTDNTAAVMTDLALTMILEGRF